MNPDVRFTQKTRRPSGAPNVEEHQRLVRDKIPEMLEAMGNIPVYQVLSRDRLPAALCDEVVRSAEKFASTASLEALADVLDCIDAWLETQGLSLEDVARVRAERRKRCGDFRQGVFLECVADGASTDALQHRTFRC
ncbi:hypothetical protein GCM10025857_36610 [Alicyclobacillus contaminans]|uniref:nucleoside triphosphate pyrophosphohydrolase n=1 Tax=Alicyclobacillus contaminans TaxID=392016 RepID=UPI0004786E97|nr:nucleoside triphosphate pyrophosphohydrolase [Alicyclobacillus contaminans]GMA52304.1 hypothetical protein GCM10025857_36610 [Alicyclobacillus contaminans]